MAFIKKVWKNRKSEFPNRRIIRPTGIDNEYEVSRSEGVVSEEGDSLDAENFNDLEQRIANAIAALVNDYVKKTGDEMTGGLALKKSYRPTLYFRHENGEEIASVYADHDTARFMISVSATDQKSYKEIYSLPVPPTGMDRSKWYDIMTSKGGKFVGNVTLAGAPTADLHPATKKYVDAVKTTADTAKNTADKAMPKGGGDFVGNISIAAGKKLDFINKDGGKLRIIGGSQSNTTAIRIVDSNDATIAELLQVDTTTGDFVGGKLAKGTDELWVNGSVASAFGNQTITINSLKNYIGVWIVYRYSKSVDTRTSIYIPTNLGNKSRTVCTVGTESATPQYFRAATVWSGTVQFGDAYMAGGARNNDFAIPVAIYGIK